MNISVEKLPKSEMKVSIELSLEETTKHLEKAAKQVSGMVKVPGFRPGQAPMEVLKKHVKEGAIEAHMLDMAIPETYTEAVKKEDIQVISRPQVKVLSDVPLKYEATVAIYPEVKISGYDKIKVKPQDAKVEDKDIDAVLNDIQTRQAKYVKVDREAKKGDRAEIDFEGFDEGGAPLENTNSKHHPVILGENTLVPGFEDELLGLKKGDKKEFTVTFPKDYSHKPFQKKKVVFKVFIHEIEEVQKPEFTPEFLKQITGQDKTLDEVKKDIRENLERERQQAEKNRQEDEFLDKVADMTKADVPNALLEEELDSMLEEFTRGLEERGLNMEQYLEGAKTTVEELRKMREKEAEKRLKLRFGLQQIFKQEEIKATDEEMKKEMETISALYPEAEREKLKKEYEEGSYLRRRLENKIMMDKLFATYLFK